MFENSGIVFIYDTENDNAKLKCYLIDAKEFLKSPRWSASPDSKNDAVADAKPLETNEDSGKAMQLKGESKKTLQLMAEKAWIVGWKGMNKSELVYALLSA